MAEGDGDLGPPTGEGAQRLELAVVAAELHRRARVFARLHRRPDRIRVEVPAGSGVAHAAEARVGGVARDQRRGIGRAERAAPDDADDGSLLVAETLQPRRLHRRVVDRVGGVSVHDPGDVAAGGVVR